VLSDDVIRALGRRRSGHQSTAAGSGQNVKKPGQLPDRASVRVELDLSGPHHCTRRENVSVPRPGAGQRDSTCMRYAIGLPRMAAQISRSRVRMGFLQW
jgi:hypothetical protein